MARLMKDSGIPWIGEIPVNWETPKVLQCLQMPITDGPHTTPEFFDEGIPFISAEAVSSGNGRISYEHKRGYISREFYNECCQKYVPQIDDVYMIKSGATTGRVAIVDTDQVFTIWSPLAVFRADPKKILPFFLFYSLQADYFQKQIENAWSFGTQQNIGMRVLEKIRLCLPPVCIQTRIVNFLDAECARIDAIIEQTRATVEEYKKLKQSIITQAVTKGIRPNRPMKDSGIEWIGEIPEDWDVESVKKHFSVTLGKMIDTDEDENLFSNYLCASNIKWDGVNKDVQRRMYFSQSEKSQYALMDGDVLIMEGGATAGTACIYHNEFSPCYMQNSVLRCRPFRSDNLTKFLFYWLYVVYHSGHIESVCNASTFKHYTKEKVQNTPYVPVPIFEQQFIVSFLDSECAHIDSIIRKKLVFIEELLSFKKSLIYEYVTGKKEVL